MNSFVNGIASQDCKSNNDELNIASPQSIGLHESENAWKPSYKRGHSLDEKEQLQRHVQAALNKLTFQKFKILLSQIENLKFNKIEDLDLVINLIYENAVYEPQFSILYANLCKELNLIQFSVFSASGNQANFHERLITKCLEEFEQCCIKHRNEANCVDERNVIRNMQAERLQLMDDKRRKVKCRQIGILRFIGELFNFSILSNTLVCECIEKLLNLENEESLELFCQLIKTAGKILDETEGITNPCGGNSVDAYFEKINSIVEKHLTSTRIRFMLQDIIELRKNNWIPRRAEMIPKTVDEIRRQVEIEISQNANFENNQMASPKYYKDLSS